MFDLVMSMLAEGLGKAGVATEASMAGEFAIASREYAAAAGIFDFLSKDQLPKWISRGSKIDADQLPIECSLGIASALKILFQANGQQMAVATVLIKSGTPNYSLVAKLCFGIAEQLEAFVAAVREDSFKQMARMDKDFFTLITFQTQIHRSLSQYFHARSLWEQQGEYGTAIAILHDAMEAIQVRSSAAGKGIPDANSTRALIPLGADIKKLREHMKKLLRYWEKDNSSVYFERVPHHVPEEKKLQAGIQMKKMEKYKLADAEPLLLAFPEGTEGQMERSDSDLMKELQALEIEELEKELAGM
uniref:BRO1 domain-containing protein n=1 Tax=Craspedostauros australis TaxID=1486917 RepID=A0A7R9WV67_9STRA|mmetsp:Transcript_22307/g.62225  ORF Transcript_22307/g.62225 Transcript_22307/m.62225 type:complete len:304 (+) Transcript_22307:324-1235(+)